MNRIRLIGSLLAVPFFAQAAMAQETGGVSQTAASGTVVKGKSASGKRDSACAVSQAEVVQAEERPFRLRP